MKIIHFQKDENKYYGILKNNNISVIEGDIFSDYKETHITYKLSDIKVLPPCMPSKVVAVGLNYKNHAQEFGENVPDEPKIFIKPSTAVIAHKEYIEIPEQSARVDYEAEMAIVIKKKAKNVDIKYARDYVLGYTCLNDVTARDLQQKDVQWTRAKGFDTFAPMGPVIETEIDPDNLPISCFLNGKKVQSSNTDKFIFKTDFLISYISSVMTLLPGDVITTGTPEGIGRMVAGDEVKVVVEGIGELVNYVK